MKRPIAHHQNILSAFRHTIKAQVKTFRREAYQSVTQLPCEMNGRLLRFDECEVDHQGKPFKELVSDFLEHKTLSEAEVKIKSLVGGGCRLADASLKTEWAAYHQRHAKLRLLSPEANQGIPPEEVEGWLERRAVARHKAGAASPLVLVDPSEVPTLKRRWIRVPWK